MSLPYYGSCGWEAVVLCVGQKWQHGVGEQDLLETVPAGTRIVPTRAIPWGLARWIGVGNLGLRSWAFLLWRGCLLLRRERFDLVFFSNTQFITFTLGPIWRYSRGIPYVLDVQDPWRTDYYERPGSRRPPGGWKYQFARFLAWMLEGWCFRNASGVVSVSPDYLDDLRRRYPLVKNVPGKVIRFGASRTDLDLSRKLAEKEKPLPLMEGKINLLYTGASGPVMPHALNVLFEGLSLYRRRSPERARRFQLHFVGTSYVPSGRGIPSVLPIAEHWGVGEQVSEIPHRVGFLEALRMQDRADALLLLGSSDLAYSPSKAYLYYLTGRPILGLVFRGSVMEALLDELRCAFMVRFSEGQPKNDAHARIADFLDLAIDGFPPGSLPERNNAYFDSRFLAEELTRQQCRLFEAAATRSDRAN